jgi:glycosyltransferase involved in cell wall biosynthesis
MASGIIWVGDIFGYGGYPQVTRNYLKGLIRLGIPLRIMPIGIGNLDSLESIPLKELEHSDVGRNPVVVIHNTPEIFTRIYAKNVSKRVGCTIFETDRIPDKWVRYCNQMDKVWVPSKFNFETFSRAGVKPSNLRVIPYGIDTSIFKPRNSSGMQSERRPFCFLYVSNFSWRKGFDLLVEAYFKEFTEKDDVSLILKTDGTKEMVFSSIAERVGLTRDNLPHITFINKPLTQNELIDLYAKCDLYISTDRANGWGMPCMEAMAMGKPAATINWSGSTEFMNKKNSLLIQPTGKLVPVDERLSSIYHTLRGHQWAEVHVEEVQRVLRFAYENPEVLREIGQHGLKDVHENFSVEKIAGRIIKELELEVENPGFKNAFYRGPVVKFKRRYTIMSRLRNIYRQILRKIK